MNLSSTKMILVFLKTKLLTIAALLFFLGIFMTVRADSYTYKISAIKVEGNKNVASLVIFGHLNEKVGDTFSADSLRRIDMDIHNLFSMGDFQDVKADVEPAEKTGEVVLTFKVVERPVVSQILFKGNKKWDSKKFMEDMKTAPKAPFIQSKLNDDVEGIKKMYEDEGYSNVGVSASTKVNSEKNTAEVTIEITEGFQIKIGTITVKGAQVFSEKKVYGQMKDNKSGDKYKPESLNDDLKLIEDFYHDEGYLKAVVLSHEEKVNLQRKRAYITIVINEGEQYTVGNIDFQGNTLYDNDTLLKAIGLKKGAILRKKDLEDGLKQIKTMMADKGYIYGSLAPNMKYDDELKKVDLSLVITEGQVAYVQDIKIVGNYKTRDYVIRRELEINAGDKFEVSKIRASQQNLMNLGYFEDVNPEIEPGDSPGKEVLVFRVKERKTGSISVGGGYSSVDGLVGNVKLEEANLFGKGQHVTLDVEFGLYRSINLGFTEPWLFNTRTSFAVNLFDSTHIFLTAVDNPDGTNQFYTQTSIGGTVSVGRRLSHNWSIFGTYSLQNVQIYNIDSYYTTPGTAQYIQATDSTTSSITPRIVYDSRDNYFEPTTGWKHQVSVEFAGGPLGFDNNFIKVIEDSSHFIPMPAGFVFAEHVRFGGAEGYSFGNKGFTDLPIYEKFFAGGTDTIRGYNERSVGPVTGGDALFVSNTELHHVIVGPLRGVLFFDAGNSWTSVWNLDESHVQYGAGLGLRLTIPGTIMSIRLDYGWPIDTELSTAAAPRTGVLHFNLGDLF